MSRRYDEQVEVRRGLVGGAEAPAQFLWRDRLFLVQGVLAHWVETGAWWRSPAARAVHGVEEGEGEGPPGRPGAADPAAGVRGASVALGLLADDEREVWRVEAAAGRWSPSGVFDLALDWSSGSWVLVRTHD
ncbi:MAG TPA: DUF6504 family protein [Jiangellales bacterium]|nr:DUF6504 family protein [Jiangellales bacterium]